MKLHNKLRIVKGDKEFISYNNLLLPTIEFLCDNKAYFSFLAIGDNGEETTENQERLNGYQKTFPLKTTSYNIDPSKGKLYITKTLQLDETDTTPLVIRELGVTADGESENPKIANRFLSNLGEPIYRDAGEEMSFEVTIYLEQDGNSQAVFTAGDNNLVKYLLGDYENSYNGHPPFLIARGYDTTANSEIISRPNFGIMLTLATVEKTLDTANGTYEMKIYADIGSGEVKEFLLSMDNQIVLRSNTSELYGEKSGLEKTIVADWDNMATLDVLGLKSIDSVTDMTTGEEITDYTTCVYGTSFTDGFRRIFQDMGYTKDTKRVVSKDGLKIGFVYDNTMDIYDFSGDSPVLMATNEKIDTTDAYVITIIKEHLLIKWHNQEEDTYGVRFYYYHDDKWYLCRYRLTSSSDTRPGVKDNDMWYDYDVTIASPSFNNDIVYMLTSNYSLFGLKSYINAYELFSNRTYFNNALATHNLTSMLPTNRQKGGLFIMHNELKDNVGVTNGIDSYYSIDSEYGLDVVKNYNDNGYPYASRNFVFAVDDEQKALKAFSIDAKEGKTLSFLGAEKLYVSHALDYIVVKDEEFKYRVFYLDTSLNLYEFIGGLPYISTRIVDIEFVNTKIIMFLEDGRVISRQINLNKTALVGVEKGHEILVKYTADNAPGKSGGNVRAIVKITTTI